MAGPSVWEPQPFLPDVGPDVIWNSPLTTDRRPDAPQRKLTKTQEEYQKQYVEWMRAQRAQLDREWGKAGVPMSKNVIDLTQPMPSWWDLLWMPENQAREYMDLRDQFSKR